MLKTIFAALRNRIVRQHLSAQKKNALRVSRGTFKRRVPFYFLRGPTFAICALMNIFELSTPGVCPCRSNSIFTW